MKLIIVTTFYVMDPDNILGTEVEEYDIVQLIFKTEMIKQLPRVGDIIARRGSWGSLDDPSEYNHFDIKLFESPGVEIEDNFYKLQDSDSWFDVKVAEVHLRVSKLFPDIDALINLCVIDGAVFIQNRSTDPVQEAKEIIRVNFPDAEYIKAERDCR